MAEGSRKRQRLDSLIESAKDIYNENETRRKENLHLQNEVTRLKLDIGELEVAKIDLAEVKKQLSHKSQECTERELDIARITKHNEEEATRSKTNLVAHEKVKMDLAQVQGELDQKNQECARRELDVLRLQGEITRSKAGLVEFEKVKNDLIQVRTTLEEKSQECARRELDVAQITKSNRQKRAVIKSHNAMRVEIGRFQSIHDQLRSSIVQLRTDNSKIDNDRQELEVKNARLGAKAARLEQEAEDRIEDMGSKIGEIRKLKQQIDEFRHRDSATGEDGIAIVRNEPGHEDESDLIEVTAAQSQSTYLGTASGNGFGSTDPSTVLVFRNATDWDARIAAMSREKLVELYKQIFEILCTFNAHPQASLKSTILSALTGNMTPHIARERQETWPQTLQLWKSRLLTATEADLKSLLSILLPQILGEIFVAKRIRIEVGTGLLPAIDSEHEQIEISNGHSSAVECEDEHVTWPLRMKASQFGSEESSTGGKRSIRLRGVEKNYKPDSHSESDSESNSESDSESGLESDSELDSNPDSESDFDSD